MPQRPLHPLPHFDILMELSGLMVKAEEEKPLVDDLPESPPTIPAERSDLVIKAEDDKASFDDSHESPQTIPAEQADIVVKAEDVAAISDAESIISGVQTDSDMSDMDAPALLSSRGTVAEDFVEAPHHSTPGTQRSLWSPFKLSNTFLVITVVAVVASVGAVYHPTNSLLPRLQSHHLTDLRAGINYATRDTGAQTIPDITSPTRGLSPPSFLLSAFTFVTGYDFEQESIKLPVEALYEELAPGQCWEFSGSRGQLGIILSRTTTVRGLKVSHVDAEDASVRTLWGPRAPKDMTLWGFVDGESLIGGESSDIPQEPVRNFVLPGRSWSLAVDGAFEELGTYQFNATAAAVQWFAVENPRAFSIVLVEFHSNWGAESTCVYNVGILG